MAVLAGECSGEAMGRQSDKEWYVTYLVLKQVYSFKVPVSIIHLQSSIICTFAV
jgi:hypothetical protein